MKRFAVTRRIALAILALGIGAHLGCERSGDARAAQHGTFGDRDPHRLVEAGATLLDVRTPEEFAERHLARAINVPVQVLASQLAAVPKDKPVVVYCRSGSRSARAAAILRGAGYDVVDVGPMSRW